MLSLFDGISCCQIALNKANIPYNKYYSSEIDTHAIKVTQHNYPDTIQLYDITKWKTWDIDWKSIDLIVAGSPCQGFSYAGKQLNFGDPRSKLFFIFVDILNHLKSINPNIKFLLENVKMKQEYQDVISENIGVNPITINSRLVSAQNRVRLYWCNWRVNQPEDKNLYLKDILEYGFVDRDKSFCLDANYWKGGNLKSYFEKHRRQLIFDKPFRIGTIKEGRQGERIYSTEGKAATLSSQGGGVAGASSNLILATSERGFEVRPDGKTYGLTTVQKDTYKTEGLVIRKLTPIECERLQTVPDNYTSVISNTQRYKALGNGFTVDVIAHILKCQYALE